MSENTEITAGDGRNLFYVFRDRSFPREQPNGGKHGWLPCSVVSPAPAPLLQTDAEAYCPPGWPPWGGTAALALQLVGWR